MFPFGRDGTYRALAAIRENDEGIVPEELRDCRFVIPDIFLVGFFEIFMRGLVLHYHERDPVDEPDEIASPLVEIPGDPELRGEEKFVILRVLPVDDLHIFGDGLS